MTVLKSVLDLENLEAGCVVERNTCEQLIGYPMTLNRYEWQFQLMQICERLQKDLWNLGKHLTVVTRKCEIHVLTHEQASEYNASRFDLAIKKMRKCHKRLTAVDVSTFAENTLVDHNKAIVKQSRILTAIKNTKANIEVRPHDSGLPKRS